MVSIFFGICPICGVPHDEGRYLPLRDDNGKEHIQYLCLNCVDKMSDFEKKNKYSLDNCTLNELKKQLETT